MRCSQRGCNRNAPMALGWGLSTGLNQWWCIAHFPAALARLAGLLAVMRRI